VEPPGRSQASHVGLHDFRIEFPVFLGPQLRLDEPLFGGLVSNNSYARN
jgi:hypothetical protein